MLTSIPSSRFAINSFQNGRFRSLATGFKRFPTNNLISSILGKNRSYEQPDELFDPDSYRVFGHRRNPSRSVHLRPR